MKSWKMGNAGGYPDKGCRLSVEIPKLYQTGCWHLAVSWKAIATPLAHERPPCRFLEGGSGMKVVESWVEGNQSRVQIVAVEGQMDVN